MELGEGLLVKCGENQEGCGSLCCICAIEICRQISESYPEFIDPVSHYAPS